MIIILHEVDYPLMAYEKQLLKREIETFFQGAIITHNRKTWRLDEVNHNDYRKLKYLTFIKEYEVLGEKSETLQAKLEHCSYCPTIARRQRTRYSVNGLHEYKGKFNPQIVHSIINVLGVDYDSSRILDPFCGSGTTLLECSHLGLFAKGVDVNPMATYITNVKLKSLHMDIESAQGVLPKLIATLKKTNNFNLAENENKRIKYLQHWIPTETLAILERIRVFLRNHPQDIADFYNVVASDLIRDYSNQEPADLRIRRRVSPFPQDGFLDVFERNAKKFIQQLQATQQSINSISCNNAICGDVRTINQVEILEEGLFDFAITSPPYITALPYIDTQRISLVWLGLCEPHEIKRLETILTGSREFIASDKSNWIDAIQDNSHELPKTMTNLILDMKNALTQNDGFRKQAMPLLVYRYLSDMKSMFLNVSNLIETNGKFALVVGHNKTTLGDREFLIDTPTLLAELATICNWKIEELIPLQTYKRYGIHSKNAITKETLIILKNCRKET